jgi:hypothetical protein
MNQVLLTIATPGSRSVASRLVDPSVPAIGLSVASLLLATSFLISFSTARSSAPGAHHPSLISAPWSEAGSRHFSSIFSEWQCLSLGILQVHTPVFLIFVCAPVSPEESCLATASLLCAIARGPLPVLAQGRTPDFLNRFSAFASDFRSQLLAPILPPVGFGGCRPTFPRLVRYFGSCSHRFWSTRQSACFNLFFCCLAGSSFSSPDLFLFRGRRTWH